MVKSYMELRYDSRDKIVYASHPVSVALTSRADIKAHFDEGIDFCKKRCGGERVYILVDYTNLTAELDEINFYAEQVKRVISEAAITVIRYGGSFLQRTAGRMTAIKLHVPSNMYPDLKTAVGVVRGIRSGTITLRQP